MLIGAHTIGQIRNTFGEALPWVFNGDDHATADGPVFDNAFHNFLINDIVATTASGFDAANGGDISPFAIDFGTWFRSEDPRGMHLLNHLDTDIALAFPSEDTSVHPDYHQHTVRFANDNDEFVSKFFVALDKMSMLGVGAETVSQPTACTPSVTTGCGTTGTRRLASEGGLNLDDAFDLMRDLGNATAFADQSISEVQAARKDEIEQLTIPRFVAGLTTEPTKKPTPLPTSLPTVSALRGIRVWHIFHCLLY